MSRWEQRRPFCRQVWLLSPCRGRPNMRMDYCLRRRQEWDSRAPNHGLRGWRGRSRCDRRRFSGGAGEIVNVKPGRAASGTARIIKRFPKTPRRLSVVRARACVLRQRGGMRRSGALTLGLVLTLGGVTGGRGQELSGSLAAANTPSLGGFALPALPENWADLPFTLNASQTESYSSNINGIPLGVPVPVGEARADLTSTTNLGFATKANVYNQQLYLDATFGVIRYLRQTGFDSNIYSLSAGDNWKLTSRCSGNLGVVLDKSPVTLLTTLVGTGVNYATTDSFNETGKCAVSNGF